MMFWFSRRLAVAGLVLAGAPAAGQATTVSDYLRDGWDMQGFSNATVAQILLRKKDRLLLCTLTAESELNCAEISNWHVNGAK